MVQRTLALLTVLVATVLGVNNESAEPVKTYHGSEVLVAKLNVEVDVPALKAIDRFVFLSCPLFPPCVSFFVGFLPDLFCLWLFPQDD